MKLFALLSLVLLIASVSAAGPIYTSTHSVECTEGCTVIDNSDRYWASGSDLNKIPGQVYTDGAAGRTTLTAPGPAQYQTSENLDATHANVYRSSSYLDFQNGGINSESLSMTDIAPNVTDLSCTASNMGVAQSGTVGGNVPNSQWANGQKTAIAQSMNLQTAKFINDAEYDLSSQATWTGKGMYIEDFAAGAQAGSSKNSSTENYLNEVRSHHGTITNSTANTRVRSDDSWGDFSSPFVTKAALNITNTTNQTEQ